jgi:hypothetical protein
MMLLLLGLQICTDARFIGSAAEFGLGFVRQILCVDGIYAQQTVGPIESAVVTTSS